MVVQGVKKENAKAHRVGWFEEGILNRTSPNVLVSDLVRRAGHSLCRFVASLIRLFSRLPNFEYATKGFAGRLQRKRVFLHRMTRQLPEFAPRVA